MSLSKSNEINLFPKILLSKDEQNYDKKIIEYDNTLKDLKNKLNFNNMKFKPRQSYSVKKDSTKKTVGKQSIRITNEDFTEIENKISSYISRKSSNIKLDNINIKKIVSSIRSRNKNFSENLNLTDSFNILKSINKDPIGHKSSRNFKKNLIIAKMIDNDDSKRSYFITSERSDSNKTFKQQNTLFATHTSRFTISRTEDRSINTAHKLTRSFNQLYSSCDKAYIYSKQMNTHYSKKINLIDRNVDRNKNVYSREIKRMNEDMFDIVTNDFKKVEKNTLGKMVELKKQDNFYNIISKINSVTAFRTEKFLKSKLGMVNKKNSCSIYNNYNVKNNNSKINVLHNSLGLKMKNLINLYNIKNKGNN